TRLPLALRIVSTFMSVLPEAPHPANRQPCEAGNPVVALVSICAVAPTASSPRRPRRQGKDKKIRRRHRRRKEHVVSSLAPGGATESADARLARRPIRAGQRTETVNKMAAAT